MTGPEHYAEADFSLTDSDGSFLVVQTGAASVQCAFIDTDAEGTWVLPHQVPAVCRALYEAAGLDVPDLPDIPDPVLAEHLAEDLMVAFHPESIDLPLPLTLARKLLAMGWVKSS